MIRTRDLVIFLGALCFLTLCIALTISRDMHKSVLQDIAVYFDPSVKAPELTAQSPQQEINRDDIITRLRNALAQNDQEVVPSPSVESEAKTASSTQEQENEQDHKYAEIQRCGSSDDAAVHARSWPLSGVSFRVQSGLREVVHTQAGMPQAVDMHASTTEPAITQSDTVLLQLPASPYILGEPACVPSDVIGVTTAGSLMYNTEASFYKGYGPEYLIGYARDGFPIYGYYQGEVDSCGGYMHAEGYRYTVTTDRDSLISCFVGAPSNFTSQ